MDFGLPSFFGFAYGDDQIKLVKLLNEAKKKKEKLILMAAPSFVVDFDYKNFVTLMKSLGFDKVTELTFGAKTINEQYYKYIKKHYSDYIKTGKKKDENFQELFISSVCPASVELVKNQFPQLKKNLLPFDSPMSAMAKVVRKNYPKHKIIFLSPCYAKKIEASKLHDKKGKKLIEVVVTFSEMKQIVAKEKVHSNKKVLNKFDSFVNDYTKIYPLAGGLCGTLHYKEILKNSDVISCDGFKSIQKKLKNPKFVFADILFCDGGCIGGPGIASKFPKFIKKQKVIRYVRAASRESMNGKQGLLKHTTGIDFSREP
jgi:iron only hydrogenase large subunit-like protein